MEPGNAMSRSVASSRGNVREGARHLVQLPTVCRGAALGEAPGVGSARNIRCGALGYELRPC